MTSTASVSILPPPYGNNAYLLVEDILARNVRGDVTSDRVSNSIRTVGVELSSRVSLRLDISMGT